MTKHIVKEGDTWWNLAKRYNVSLPNLLKTNPHILNRYPLPIEETITIPESERIKILKLEGKGDDPSHSEASTIPMPSESSDVEQTAVGPETANDTPAGVFTPFPVVNKLSEPKFSKAEIWGELGTYICQAGDTWETIAERFYITLEHLKAANPHLIKHAWLSPGIQINIPSIGMTLYEQMKSKQQSKYPTQNSQSYLQPPNPYITYPTQYVSAKDWVSAPYPFYRCMCPECMRSQAFVPLDELESESLARSVESSSFWGSSSYFDSTSLINESSSSWLTEGH